ncbi:hypothetical protein ACIA5H_37305 [Nocardia sp. NPDC051900]|uniref:hypothetical protein n=1 Tax=Nocardia sp. NPDC051900 TaxID=3364326 RepID=UPI0037ADA9CA
MSLPVPIGQPGGQPGDVQSDLLHRIGFIRDRLSHQQRFDMIGRLLVQLRDNLYPGMHILAKADGSLVVTIPRPQADQ